MQSEKRGRQRFDRLGWAEIREWGVFATRSPFRPNPIGLSVVTLDQISWKNQTPRFSMSMEQI